MTYVTSFQNTNILRESTFKAILCRALQEVRSLNYLFLLLDSAVADKIIGLALLEVHWYSNVGSCTLYSVQVIKYNTKTVEDVVQK